MEKRAENIILEEINNLNKLIEEENDAITVTEKIYKEMFAKAQPVLSQLAELESDEEKINSLLICVQSIVNETGQTTVNLKNSVTKARFTLQILNSLQEKILVSEESEKKSAENITPE